jgi:hypothetical protein
VLLVALYAYRPVTGHGHSGWESDGPLLGGVRFEVSG